mgnify:CR=1 FL=1
MFSSSIFFPSLKSLWQVRSQVADKLSGKFFSGAAKTQYMTRSLLLLLSLGSLEDAWNGRDSLAVVLVWRFLVHWCVGFTEFIEKANDSIIFLLRGTFLEWVPNQSIVEKQKKLLDGLDVVNYYVTWKSEQLHSKMSCGNEE